MMDDRDDEQQRDEADGITDSADAADPPGYGAEDLAAAQARIEANRLAMLRRDALEVGVKGAEVHHALTRIATLAATPEHQAAVARAEAALRASASRALVSLAREREIPEDEDLRGVALEPEPPETPALAALRAALEWRRGRRCGCVAMVGGPRGLGKSCALAWVLLRSEVSALYVQAPEVTATPRNGFSENEHRWSRWLSVPLLGLDDLGTEAGDAELVAALLWQRYDRGLRTLVTTNLSRTAVSARYFRGEIGPRLADRLVNAQGRAGGDGGLPWYAPVTGDSLRDPKHRDGLHGGVSK